MDLSRGPDIDLKGGPHGIPREVVQEIQRGRVLEAAIAAVGSDGFRRATVGSILGRAGVSRRTFYELFADREDCFLQAYGEATDQLLGTAAAACAAAPEEMGVEAALRAMLEQLAARPDVARACVVEVLSAGPAATERRASVVGRLTAMLAPRLPQGEHTRLRAQVLVGGLHELVHERIVAGRTAALTELVDEPVIAALVRRG